MSSNEKPQEIKDVAVQEREPSQKPAGEERKWEKPVLDDVSGKVMAQPYIRFT